MQHQSSDSSEPIKVGITVGDVNGIGIETIIKCFSDNRLFDDVIPVIYGNQKVVNFHRKALGNDRFQFFPVESADAAKRKKANLVNAWEHDVEITLGKPSKEAGKCALASLKMAVDDLASNKTDVLVTCPIDKDSIQGEDFQFAGHTEFLSEMSNVSESLMFLVADDLRVGIVTGHIPLKEISEKLTADKIVGKLRLMKDSLSRDFHIPSPKIAVLALNPHAGDNGLMGDEEKEIIAPAIRQAKGEDIYAFGPFPADGFFGSGQFKNYDGVLAMYHDQGLAPFKALTFDSGVNFTAGLPIVRTSPDHGTAYDIAGQNVASASSLREAIFLAIDIFKNRKLHREINANPLEIVSETRSLRKA